MNIVIRTGCTADSIVIDGKHIQDMSPEESNKFLEDLLLKMREHLKIGCITIHQMIELFQYDSWEIDKSSCGQCGDSVSTTTYNL